MNIDARLQSKLGDLATGVPVIDEEHARLIDLEGRLAVALRGKDDAEVFRVFNELIEYMAEHFAHEESLMGCLPLESSRRHKEEHANISSRLVQFIGRPDSGARLAVNAQKLAEVVVAWLENHIRYWDMPLARIMQREHRVGDSGP